MSGCHCLCAKNHPGHYPCNGSEEIRIAWAVPADLAPAVGGETVDVPFCLPCAVYTLAYTPHKV